MYKLTLALFSLFSLVPSIVAVPALGPKAGVHRSTSTDNLEKRNTTYTGTATPLELGFVFGACGKSYSDSDLAVALPVSIYDNGAHCLQTIQVNYGDKSVEVVIVDSCPDWECDPTELNLTPTAFESLSALSQGVIDVTWEYV